MDMMWPDVPSGDLGFSLGANGLPGGPVVKNLSANTGGTGSIPGSGRSLEKDMATHSSILVWESHEQGSLAGCSPGGQRVRYDLLAEHTRMHWELMYSWRWDKCRHLVDCLTARQSKNHTIV